MKNLMLKSIASVILCSVVYLIGYPALLQAQELPKVYWLRGFHVATYEGDFKSSHRDYIQQIFNVSKTSGSEGLGGYGLPYYMGWKNISEIANELAPKVEKPAVLIGHSMGGLIARKIALDKLVSGKGSEIKGVITIGTPNQGAPVLNTADVANKLFQDVVNPKINSL